jgi:TetR/AcrR family transcriptional repressor of nem operon
MPPMGRYPSCRATRQAPEARAAVSAGLRRRFAFLSAAAPSASAAEWRRVAIGSWAAMVGAAFLAPLGDDPQLSDEQLEQTCALIDDKATTREFGEG